MATETWEVEQSQNGAFVCRHTRLLMCPTQFETEEQAQAWADATNKANEIRITENKRIAAERKASRAAKGPLADQYFVDPHAH